MLFKLSERSSNSFSNHSIRVFYLGFDSGLTSNQERSYRHKKANQTQATINLSITQNLSQNLSQSNIQQSNIKPKSISEQLKVVRNRGSIGSGLKESDILA